MDKYVLAVFLLVPIFIATHYSRKKIRPVKKLIWCLNVLFIIAISLKPVLAGESNLAENSNSFVERYILSLYNHIDFGKYQCLSYDVFDKAYKGYLNLREAGKLNADNEVLSICDFTLSSTQNRLWIIDLRNEKVIFNTYVAHGRGSGEEFADKFSNKFSSHQSSLGFYVTGDTYDGEHGMSLYLNGMDNDFNDAAFGRGIVVHGADYVSEKHIASNNYIGRSWGCPAVPSKLSASIINAIKDGTCLFIYYPEKDYLQASYWLNKHIDHLPEDNMTPDFKLMAKNSSVQDTVIQFISKGNVDSVIVKKRSF
jgi:hypothetical protein